MMYPCLLPIWASVTKNAHARCFGKLALDSGISDERCRLFIFPDCTGVGLPVQQRDLHKAKLLIASLWGGLILTMSSLASATDRNHRKQQRKGFQPTLHLPCGVCQTKEDPLIWSQQESSSVGSSADISGKKS